MMSFCDSLVMMALTTRCAIATRNLPAAYVKQG
jgi:hypothetical protein